MVLKYILIVFLLATSLFAESLVVFSAANLKFFFEDIQKAYCEKYPDDKIKIKFGSSGVLTKDILNGEKYDIFLAANMVYPQKVYDTNNSIDKPKLYATGSIILLIAAHKGLDDKGINILNDKKIKEITIANKKTAPYGVAALEALKNSNLYDKLKSKIIYSTDASNIIGDVLWYGNAGLLPKSAINFLPRGYNIKGENWIDVDQKLYTPIKQGFVISKDGAKKDITKRFIKFILGDGQEIFKKNGYK
jgi:molybdate transport system substrate-binding protein